MIGVNLRSVHHLWRLCNGEVNKVLIRVNDYGYDICDVIKTDFNGAENERMFIFNSYINRIFSNRIFSLKDELGINRPKVFEVTEELSIHPIRFFNDIVLLPKSFEKDYELFLKGNAKLVKRLQDKYGFYTNDVTLKRLYIYSNGSKNFFEWAVEVFYGGSCSMEMVQRILLWNDFYSHLSKKLSKATITAYRNHKTIDQLMEELRELRNEKRINDSISSFNTAQKKLLKSNELSEKDKQALIKFSKLSDTKKSNFIQKVSTIEDFQELMRLMKLTTSVHFEWSKESFMDYLSNVENLNYEIIFESDLIVLIKVFDYETIKQLGKTTNWCISKNKKYWNSYIDSQLGMSQQYMIFDFSKMEDDKLSIVGFTSTKNRGITSAHNFTNDDINGNIESRIEKLKSFLGRTNKKTNIFSVLETCGIDAVSVMNYDKPRYEWNSESLLSYLYECVNKDDVAIIKNDGNKLVFSVCDENIKYFFGDAYRNGLVGDSNLKHFVFVDFSKNQYDPNRILFTAVHNGSYNEEYCTEVFNLMLSYVPIDIDGLMSAFEIPYDIIKRPFDIERKIRNAFVTFDIKTLKSEIKNNRNLFLSVIKNIGDDGVRDYLLDSIFVHHSFDYFNLIYDNGDKMEDYMKAKYISSMFISIFEHLKRLSHQLFRRGYVPKPTQRDIDRFFDKELDEDFAKFVADYLILKKIFKNEGKGLLEKTLFLRDFYISINEIGVMKNDLPREFIELILEKVDLSKKNEQSLYLIQCLQRYNDAEALNIIDGLKKKYSWLENVLNEDMPQECVPSITTSDAEFEEFLF